MAYNFDEFKLVGSRFTPIITIARSGGIGFTSGFHRKYQLERYKAVKLFFDLTAGVIAVKLLDEQQEGSFKLNVRPNGGGAYLSAKSFMDKYDIKPDKYAGRYRAKEIEDEKFGKLIILDPQQKES